MNTRKVHQAIQQHASNVFLFGQSGVGKSTIIAALCSYFHEARGLTPQHNIRNIDGARLIVEWIKGLRKGNFPQKTDTGLFQRVDIGFLDRKANEQFGFSFFEVAGENVVMLDPLHPQHQSRPPTLDEWLDRSHTILLIASAVPTEDDRFVLQMFLEYLKHTRRSVPTALVISEWDRLSEPLPYLEYANDQYSEVMRILAQLDYDGVPTEVIPFSIGDVVEQEKGATIERVRFEVGTEALVRWIVHSMDSAHSWL